MQVEITIKNYRCFSDEKPAKISFQEGFTGFIGPNNAGKSSLLKFFYEFRDIFALLQKPNILLNVIQGGRQEFNLASSVTDEEEVFCNINDRDLQIDIRFVDLGQETSQSGDVRPPKRLIATIPRNKHSLNAKLYLDDNPFAFEPKNIGLDGWKLLLLVNPKLI